MSVYSINRIFRLSVLLLTAAVLFTPSCSSRREKSVEAEAVKKDTVYPLGFCTDSFDVVEGVLSSGETFSSLTARLGMNSDDSWSLTNASDSVFDMKKMRAGNSWHAYFDPDSVEPRSVRYLVYDQDRVNATVFKCYPPFEAWKVAKPVETRMAYADVTITTSLWNDMLKEGVSPLLILDLSEIYAWTIDFFALQQGDRFRVLYNEETCEGEIVDVSDIRYAIFTHGGKDFTAVRFDQDEGSKEYWDEKGESLKRAFLKAPLKFTRISSGFTYHRKHPITGKVRAHTAVDYAAPVGTPVMSIGDGTVLSAGWASGGGNTVKIRHNSVYTTSYMHLSRYAKGIKAGVRVHQGEVIGYVGSTGMSTGPHLDFRVWKNGSPVNPLTLDSPKTEPILPENLPALDSTVRVYSAKMDSLSITGHIPEPLGEVRYRTSRFAISYPSVSLR